MTAVKAPAITFFFVAVEHDADMDSVAVADEVLAVFDAVEDKAVSVAAIEGGGRA